VCYALGQRDISLSSPADLPRLLRFGQFELDLRTGEIYKDGKRIKLQEQPCQVLALLIERPGELVSREELRKKLWPNDTFVDFDHGVNIAINKLRDALGDSPEKPRFIETLPRRGYRFIAPVDAPKTSRDGEPQVQVSSSPAGRAGSRSITRRRALLPALLALSFVVVFFSFVRYWRERSAENNIRSLAVLPFENLSGDPNQEYSVNGMTDELTTNLAKIKSLRVISRTSAMKYKNLRTPLAEIARSLHVDAVLEGSVVRSGDKLRITAQLIDARTDRHLWAEDYNRDLRDVVAVQDEVARRIAQEIRTTLTPEERAQLTSQRQVNTRLILGAVISGISEQKKARRKQWHISSSLSVKTRTALWRTMAWPTAGSH
jgi:TolB-like protein/DNA-binding winged helix-turn-helix (wHTH) protein